MRSRGYKGVRRDVLVWWWVSLLCLSVAPPNARGQSSQPEGGHESHHGAADPAGPSAGSADGASSGEQLIGDRRAGMGRVQSTPLFSQMLDAGGASPAVRDRIRDQAQQLMRSGAQQMSAGLAEMNKAMASDDLLATRRAALRFHQGTQQFEAGLAALDGLWLEPVPRESALR